MSEVDVENESNAKAIMSRPVLFLRLWFRRLVTVVILVIIFIVGVTLYLSPSNTPRKADVIIAISGGDTYARTMKAIDLYHAGWAPKVVLSGAALDSKSPSNAEVMKQIALASGVPPDVLETDEDARNTLQNASRSREILSDGNYHTIILVTSQYHQRRASLQFAHIFGPNVEIINQPASDYYWNKYTWWMTPQGWYLTLGELAKVVIVLAGGK